MVTVNDRRGLTTRLLHEESTRDHASRRPAAIAQVLARAAEAPVGPLGDMLFQRLLRHRIIFLGQQVDDDLANRICAELILLAAEDAKRDISLYINSPGGSVYAGMAIYDVMQYVPNDVATFAMGMAASMGQFLLCAGAAGKRYAMPHAAILMHQPHGGIGGTATDIRIQAEQSLYLKRVLAERIALHTGRPSSRSRRTPTGTAGSPPRRPATTGSSTTWSAARPRSRPSARCHEAGVVRVMRHAGSIDGSTGQGGREVSAGYRGPQYGGRGLPAESRYVLPSFVERTSYGVKEMNPYNKLFEERIIFLGVQIDDASANDVMAQLITLESIDPTRDILIYINSPGGSMTSMMAIYDTMQYIQPEIHTYCLGQAASAAAVLLAAGTKGKRFALPNSRILIHQPAVESGYGQSSDLEIQAREILRMRSRHGGHPGPAHRPGRGPGPPRHRAGQVLHRPRGQGVRAGR